MVKGECEEKHLVDISFRISGQTAHFRRNGFTGKAELLYDDGRILLQSVWRVTTHIRLNTERTWTACLGGHDIEIVMVRPQALAFALPKEFTILVDGEVVAERRGM